MPAPRAETHLVKRMGWLRASGLGVNHGILSTASLIVGVASAVSDKGAVVGAALIPKASSLVGVSLATLLALGAIGAQIGGAGILRGAARVTLWGALAMFATSGVGWVFGTAP